MAHFDDEQDTKTENDQHDGVGHDDSDFGKLYRILESRDPDGLISKQVHECLQQDDITLDLLCEFDDISLNGVIDSWKIDYSVLPNQKQFILRGLLINGIKKLRNTDNNQSPKENKQNLKKNSKFYGGMISEMEIKTLQIVEDYEKSIENELKNNQETNSNDTLLNKYKTDMTNAFDDVITKLTETKAKSLENLETTFNKNENKRNDYITSLNIILGEINEIRMKYQINVEKCQTENLKQLQERSEKNCGMMNRALQKWQQECDGCKPQEINVNIDTNVKQNMISLMNDLVTITDNDEQVETPRGFEHSVFGGWSDKLHEAFFGGISGDANEAATSGIYKCHEDIPMDRHGAPCLYTDINGKEWILIMGSSQSYRYDLQNDSYQQFIDYDRYWTATNGNSYRVSDEGYEQSCLVDNNNHILYWCLGSKSGCTLVFDIKDLPNDNYKLLKALDTHNHPDFEYGYQMFLIGNKIHYLFGRQFAKSQSHHFTYDLISQQLDHVDENFEQQYLDQLDFGDTYKDSNYNEVCNSDSNINHDHVSMKKQRFVNNLRLESVVDGRDKHKEYYRATIEQIVDSQDRDEWDETHYDEQDKLKINVALGDDIDNNASIYAYLSYTGWSSRFNEWICMNEKRLCDCRYKCDNDEHQFAMPLTQSSFRIRKKGKTCVYSKRHEKIIIVGRDEGLVCYKHVSCHWHGYYNKIDFDYNQSYYTGDKEESAIEKHYNSLIVHGWLRNNRDDAIEIPIDLYDIVLRYYYQPSDQEWVFIKNDKIPLSCSAACVLVNNESDIIILGHADREDNSRGKIYKYNIDKNELIEIQGIEMPQQTKNVDAVYSNKTDRIYLFDRSRGTAVNSIRLSSLLS